MTPDERDFVEAQDRHDERFQRYVWTGVAANGAALLAMAGIVGNVDAPDTALQALAWPLNLFIAGLAFGAVAIAEALVISALRMSEAVERRRCEAASRRTERVKPAVVEMPMSMELARLVHGAEAEQEMRKLYANVVDTALKADREAHGDFCDAMDKRNSIGREVGRITVRALRWFQISAALCVVGFFLAANTVLLGGTLQSEPSGGAGITQVIENETPATVDSTDKTLTPKGR